MRPWGHWEVLCVERGYKVKRLVVEPGKSLSMQRHFNRTEHWAIVEGAAKVMLEGGDYDCPAHSYYVERAEWHKLINAGEVPLIIIETQVGSYCGEDDIERAPS